MIAIIIPTYNHADFLSGAIESCLRQTLQADEIIVVDDGSTDNPADVVARYPGVKLLRQENRGLSAARNAGWAATNANFVAFLDADDLLTPVALEKGIASLEREPEAALTYGAYRLVDEQSRPVSSRLHVSVGENAYLQLLACGNFISMHGTVLYRRECLELTGGFDESLRSCEDYDLYLRISKERRIVGHNDLVALYRKHRSNMSKNHEVMLATALRAIDKQIDGNETSAAKRAADQGVKFWTDYYAGEMANDAFQYARTSPLHCSALLFRSLALAPRACLEVLKSMFARSVAKRMPRVLVRALSRSRVAPPVGSVRFGDFGRLSPISNNFGYDRGLPIDRYYIEAFLSENARDVRGRVLEVGDSTYTTRFGRGSVVTSDVLHVNGENLDATIVGDISTPGVLPSNAFDCVILTQTLHLIFDMSAAIGALAGALRPGGVLLITVPGITPVDRSEWGHTWFWSLTEAALRRLLEQHFDPSRTSVQAFGNVLSAVSFLQGLACGELNQSQLDVHDPAFPITIAARVIKEQ